MAFLLDCTLITQPTVLSLGTVSDARLVVLSEFHYILPHSLAVFSTRLHHSYCTCGFPFEISSKTSNLPFVSPPGILRLNCYRIFAYVVQQTVFTFVSKSFTSGINISLRLPLHSTIVSFIQALSLCYVSRWPHTSSTQILYLSLCRHYCTICQTGNVRSSSVSLVF